MKNKSRILIIFILMSSFIKCKSVKISEGSNNNLTNNKSKVFFKIESIKEIEGYYDLKIKLINNSKKEIVFLKPKSSKKTPIDFFQFDLPCDTEYMFDSYDYYNYSRSDDFIKILPNEEYAFSIYGNNYRLMCDKPSTIEVKYEVTKENVNRLVKKYGDDKDLELYQNLTEILIISNKQKI